MRPQDRARQIAREIGGVIPRSVGALTEAGNWTGRTARGLRQLGEVALDELVVTGMTLTAPPPSVHTAIETYRPVADELTRLGMAGCYAEPEPLQIKNIRWRMMGKFALEEVSYEHDPRLPDCFGELGAPTTAVCNVVRSDTRRPRPWLIWVHGAGQGNLTDLAVARVGLEVDAALAGVEHHPPRVVLHPERPVGALDASSVTRPPGGSRGASAIPGTVRR